MEEKIAHIKIGIENTENSLLRLKARREQFIAMLTRVNTNVTNITDDINHAECILDYYKEELKKIEEELAKEDYK